MKAMLPKFAAALSLIFALLSFTPRAYGEPATTTLINAFQVKWDYGHALMPDATKAMEPGGWTAINMAEEKPVNPGEAVALWIRFDLPSLEDHSAILVDKLFGQRFKVFVSGEEIYDYKRNNLYEFHRIFLPLESEQSAQTMLLYAETMTGGVGIGEAPIIGDFQSLAAVYAKTDLLDIVLGFTFLCIAFVMLVCACFLNRGQLRSWLSLSLVILSIGIMIVTYCPFPFLFYGQYGKLYVLLFDLAMFSFMASLIYFFETMIGPGPYGIVRKFRKFMVIYAAIAVLFTVMNEVTSYHYYGLYYFVTASVIGVIAIVEILLIISLALTYAIKGNREALIMSVGFGIFAVIGIGELLWYYMADSQYGFYLWKWGLVAFIFSLIVLLGQRYVRIHEQVVKYSKDLEGYNHQLQRSEKMEVISQLAASVAHEVRNPLQVTRGFLQLLHEQDRSDKELNYLDLAIKELDRASTIITDYLTFAKPELEQVTVFNLTDELLHVESILAPLVNQQGGTMSMKVAKDLYVEGSSPQLKQALINMLKNSIESLHGNGEIELSACEEDGKIMIRIADNGEGMDEEMLVRLGEPYFSSKTKGTGLGLMVTFRIIELMKGELSFKSKRGVGTEATILLPAHKPPFEQNTKA